VGIVATLGGFFGDEGKGKIANIIAYYISKKLGKFESLQPFESVFSEKPILGYGIRSNGGPNGGHSLNVKGNKVSGHVLPSTITDPNFVSMIGAGCALHPGKLVQEIESFQNAGLFSGNLVIDDTVPVILSAYMELDGLKSGRNSTGSGIRYVYEHKAKRDGILVRDLLDEKTLKTKLEPLLKDLCAEYLSILAFQHEMAVITALNDKFLQVKLKVFQDKYSLENVFQELTQHNSDLEKFVSADLSEELRSAVLTDKPIINEGSQSYFLGINSGIERGTSSIIDPLALYITQNIPITKQDVYFVVKAFGSRVGNGYFVGEYGDRSKSLRKPELLEHYGFKKNAIYSDYQEKAIELMNSDDPQEKADGLRLFYDEFGVTTGFPRGKAPLDLVALRTLYTRTAEGGINNTKLVINQMDGLELLVKDIPVIVAYQDTEGNRYDTIPAWSDEKLQTLDAVIKYLPFWGKKVQGEFSTWDKNAQDFIKYVESESGFKVAAIGNGPKQDDLILLEDIA